MRISLITEGGYPYHTGSSSSWCHQLLQGLDRHRFHLVALTSTAAGLAPAHRLPANVVALAPVPVWAAPVTPTGWRARRQARKAATRAALLLSRSLPGDHPQQLPMFRQALWRLAQLAAGGAHPLTGTPLAELLAEAWRESRSSPRLPLAEAQAAAVLLEHALRPLAVPVAPVQVCHAGSGGLPLLVALAAKWRAGIPYLVTESGIYLRERYLDYGEQLPEAVRALMLKFFGRLARLGYAEAATVVAASRFNQRWQLRHGAHPAKVVVVPGGVDPVEFAAQPAVPPAVPAVVAVGRITPSADLATLIHAHWRVRRELPSATLRLVGPVADRRYEASCRALVDELGLTGAVEFAGPVAHPAAAYAGAQVVVRTSVCEGQPYPVLEAMMSGRPVVAAEVGGTAELVGEAGVLVPPGDPVALAAALANLLRDRPGRVALGNAARQRARAAFTRDQMARAYHQLYADVAARLTPVAPPAFPPPARAVAPRPAPRPAAGAVTGTAGRR